MDAIETQWHGYTFRSRLEARYAVMFEKMGLDWRYEVQGFQLQDGRSYLPDFQLPGLDLYVEIKGTPPDRDTEQLLRDFRHPIILFVELPDLGKKSEKLVAKLHRRQIGGRLFAFSVSEDSKLGGMPFEASAYLTYCRECESFMVEVRPESRKLARGECHLIDRGNGREQWGPHCEHAYDNNRLTQHGRGSEVQEAIVAGRSARFEHGEDPLA